MPRGDFQRRDDLDERAGEIAEMYEAGASLRDCGSKFGVGHNTAARILRRNGYGYLIRAHTDNGLPVNKDYFNEIDTEEKAYWLGFIYADGCISKSGRAKEGRLSFTLAERDRGHLLKFKTAVGSNHPIREKEGGCVSLCIGVGDFVAPLREHGIEERKGTKEEGPSVPDGWEVPFWRGVFDGDGSISPETSKSGLKIDLTGSEGTVRMFKGFVGREFEEEVGSIHYRENEWGSSWRWATGGSRVAPPILDVLYSDASVALSRKRGLWRLI